MLNPINLATATPNFMRPTTCFTNASRIKKKVVIKENIYKEPSLKLLNALGQSTKKVSHIPNYTDIRQNQPRVLPPNYQEVMKKQAQEDCQKPPLPFLNKTLNSLHKFYLA